MKLRIAILTIVALTAFAANSILARAALTRAMEADARVNLCIMSNEEPFDFVSLEATGEVLTDNIADATKKVFKNIEAVGYTLPDPLDDWLAQQSRVILRLTVHRRHAVLRRFEG